MALEPIVEHTPATLTEPCQRCGPSCCDAEWVEYEGKWSLMCGGRCDEKGKHAPEQPRFPQTKAEALLALPEWEAALIFARCDYDRCRQQARNAYDHLERLRGQMAVIRDMVAGEFDEAEQQRYAQGSRGPWPINGYTPVQTEDGGS